MHHAIPLTAALALAAASCARASADEARANAGDAGVTTTCAVASATPPPASTPTAECPPSMVLVEGEYCPEVEQRCVEWLDPPGTRYEHFRCKRYAQPATCHGKRVHKRFCIDAKERTEDDGDLPRNHMSWTASAALCESSGARLCKTSEWQFACEGEEMRPYPYGFVRDAAACNIDQPRLGKPQEGLRDLRAPVSAYPSCLSPFGVHDMSGNVEEWATLDHGRAPDRSAMKGAWWLPGKNNCRAVTLGHGETYEGPQVGVRCCRDVE